MVLKGVYHTIDSFHHHEDLLPGAVVPGLTFDDGLSKDLLQMLGIVVAEDADGRFGRPRAVHDGGVVQGVRDDQGLLAHEDRNGRGVRAVAHGVDDGGFLADEVGNDAFQFFVDCVGSEVEAR